MIGKARLFGQRNCVSWLEGYKYVFFWMEDGWLKRDFNYFGGPGVLVLLAEVNQGSVD